MTSKKRLQKHYNIPIFIPHLGCPYDCIYCDQKKISAQPEAPEPIMVNSIIERYLHTIPKGSHVEVAFFGGSFTAIDRNLQIKYLQAVQPFIHQERVHSIRVSTRPDCIDAVGLDLLAAYGVKMIELGVQSLSDEVLQASARGYEAKDVFKSVHLIQEKGFDLGIQLMVGLPQDTYTKDMATTRQVVSMQPQAVRIYPTLVIAGTGLDTLWKRGDYVPLSLEQAIDTCQNMFLLFQKDNIRVIRMGLYPGEELRREGVVVAGPFHPSFGELVEQRVFRHQARVALMQYRDKYGHVADLNVHVHNRDVSKMVGQHRSNLIELKANLGLSSLQVINHQGTTRDWIGVSSTGICEPEHVLPRREFLAYLFIKGTNLTNKKRRDII